MRKLAARVKCCSLVAVIAFGLFGFSPALVGTALADDADLMSQEETIDFPEGDACLDTEYESYVSDGIEFTAWTDATRLPSAPGHYYLAQDVTLSKTWTVPRSRVDIDLNGHAIKTTDPYNWMIYVGSQVGSQVTLSLYDSSYGSGVIRGCDNCAIYVENSCTLNLYGGRITDNDYYSGSAVQISSGGVFNMFGGYITGNHSPMGVVAGPGRFTMAGGYITNNFGMGVCVTDFHVYGNPVVSGNMQDTASGLLAANVVTDSRVAMISIDGPLGEYAWLGVYDVATNPDMGTELDPASPVTFTRGLAGNGGAGSFVSDQGHAIRLNGDGEAEFYVPQFGDEGVE